MRLVLATLGFVGLGSSAALAADYIGFQSPTGNIHCVIFSGYEADSDGARCDIGEFTPSSIPAPADCEFDWGNAFWIASNGRRGGLACISDSVTDPGNPVLDYGQSVSAGGVTCVSAQNGMTCQNAAGHGFTLSRKTQRVF